jgi:hypothetical protein
LKEAMCPDFWLKKDYLEANYTFKEDNSEIIMLKEDFSMKESEENLLTKRLQDDSFPKEQIKEKIIEALFRKTLH